MKRFAGMPLGSALILLAALVGALFAPWFAPCDPDQVDVLHRFTPPFWLEVAVTAAFGGPVTITVN